MQPIIDECTLEAYILDCHARRPSGKEFNRLLLLKAAFDGSAKGLKGAHRTGAKVTAFIGHARVISILGLHVRQPMTAYLR